MFKIIPFDLSYKEQVLNLLSNVFSTVSANNHFSEEYFDWKHLNSPLGKSLMYIAVDSNNKVLAFRAFVRWEFIYLGEIKSYLRPVDSAVCPTARGRGLFKSLTLHVINSPVASAFDGIFNTPNENSLPIYLHLGWKKISNLTFSILPLYPIPTFSNNLKKISYDKLSKFTKSINKCGTNTDLTYLKWRYVDCPTFDYLYFEVSDNCIVIYRINKRYFLTEAIICDVLFKNDVEPVTFNAFDISTKVSANYLLLTKDLRDMITFKLSYPLNFNKPYFNLVEYSKSGSFVGNLHFLPKDLELF
ncbi:GNAT family N-acetyltransferase [Vibrio natriegens]|uniref:GNAT family N-acetyltransferase n=1 Tax=Vibrio natriegens TaxID=691 RepID=UPI003DA14B62